MRWRTGTESASDSDVPGGDGGRGGQSSALQVGSKELFQVDQPQAQIIQEAEGCLVVGLQGRLGYKLGTEIQQMLRVQAVPLRCVILDLSQVFYLDSSGLGSLVALQMTLRRQNCLLVLVGLKDQLMEILRTSQLIKVFQVRPSHQEALQEFCSGQVKGKKP